MNLQPGVYPVPNQPPLPQGWQLFTDSFGRPFYWNHNTKESSWTAPTVPNVPTAAYAPRQQPSQPAPQQVNRPASGSFGQSTAATSLPPGWEKAIDAQGRVYYIDHATQTTSWEPPQALQQPPTYSQANAPQMSGPYAAPVNPQSGPYASPFYQQQPGMAPGSYGYPGPYYGQPQVAPGTQPQIIPQRIPGAAPLMQSPPGMSVSPSAHLRPAPAPLASSKPTWNTTKESPRCTRCNAEFSLLLKRRHHCRCCFRQYCDGCSTKTTKVPQFGHPTPVRVCDPCFRHLGKSDNTCASKLIPYLAADQPEVERAVHEFSTLVKSHYHEKEFVEELLQLGCFAPSLEVLAAPSSPTLTAPTRLELLRVLELVSQEPAVLKSLGDFRADVALVAILGSEANAETKAAAAHVLTELARVDENRARIGTAGALKPLLEILGGSDDKPLVRQAAAAVHAIVSGGASSDANRKVAGENVSVLVIHVSNSDPELLASIIGTLEQLATLEAAALHDAGAVQALLGLFADKSIANDAGLLLQTLHAIVAMSRLREACRTIADVPDGLASLISLMDSSDFDIREQALAIIQNISKHSEFLGTLNREILFNGGLATLVGLIATDAASNGGSNAAATSDAQRIALDILSNLVENQTRQLLLDSGAIPAIFKAITPPNNANLTVALGALSKVVLNSDEAAVQVLSVGGVGILVDLLSSADANVAKMSLACLNHLATSPQVAEALSTGKVTIDALAALVSSGSLEVSKGALQLLGTICVTDHCRTALQQTTALPLIRSVLSSPDVESQKLSVKLIGQLCASDRIDDVIRDDLGKAGCIPPIIELLGSPDKDTQNHASFAIKHVARSYLNREEMIRLGALPKLCIQLSGTQDLDSKIRLGEVLAAFSSDQRSRSIIKESAGIPIFTELLFSDNDSLVLDAIMAISNFALDDENITDIHRGGGALGLVTHLSSPKENVQEAAVLALGNLAKNQECRQSLVVPETVRPILNLLRKESQAQAKAIWALGMLSMSDNLGAVIEQSGSDIEPIVALLSSPEEPLREQSLFILVNICVGFPANWSALVRSGGARALLLLLGSPHAGAPQKACDELLTMSTSVELKKEILGVPGAVRTLAAALSGDEALQEAALGTLANLSTEPESWKLIAEEAFVSIVPMLARKVDLQISAASILLNLSRSERNWAHIHDTGALGKCVELLFSGNESLALIVATMLSNISVSMEMADAIHTSGGVLGLITLLSRKQEQLLEVVALSLANCARSSSICREAIINNDGLEPIIPLLSSPNLRIQKGSLFIVEILSSSSKFCKSIEKMGGLPPLVALLRSSMSEEFQNQILNIFRNISSNGNANRAAVLQSGVLPLLFSFIASPNSANQETTLATLANLTSDRANRDAIRDVMVEDTTGLQTIVGLLGVSQVDKHLVFLTKACANLALDDTNRRLIGESDAVDALILRARSSSKVVALNAVVALDNLCYTDEIREKIIGKNILDVYLDLALSEKDSSLQNAVASALRKLTEREADAKLFASNQGVSSALVYLVATSEFAQLEVLNIAKNLLRYDQIRVLAEVTSSPSFVNLFDSPNQILKEVALQLRPFLE